MARFTSFVIFGEMRTGSNFLEMNLNRLQGFHCYGEAFNPYLLGNHTNNQLCGFTAMQREENPLGLLAAMRAQTEGLSGFRYFHNHDPRVLDTVLSDPACAKIILTRNPVESYISWKIARETDQWRLMNTRKHTTVQPDFNLGEFERHLGNIQDFQVLLLNRLQITGQTAFYLDYEDIMELDVLNGIAAFLGLKDRLKSIDSTLKKQNPEAIEDKVTNPEAMADALARMDRFNLTRTPNFEPRRNAGVPGYVGLDGPRLLFMPVAGAPWVAVENWLSQLGPVTTKFDRKSLRQWKEARPGYRSFTVLRHPLARAHAMFCTFLSTNLQPELRPYLAKFHYLPLPPQGMPFQSDADFRAAFLIFLNFLKRNLAAQTGLKVITQFASQLAVLQGFSALGLPDTILREDDLPRGLARLAQDHGLPDLPYIPDAAPAYPALTRIYGPDLETAARAAYDKDYTRAIRS
ncbi:MAG: nodulation protein NodH, partial [Cypionkella sp.]|nr:nodulation protein NodH [Cypionkella sp.]